MTGWESIRLLWHTDAQHPQHNPAAEDIKVSKIIFRPCRCRGVLAVLSHAHPQSRRLCFRVAVI